MHENKQNFNQVGPVEKPTQRPDAVVEGPESFRKQLLAEIEEDFKTGGDRYAYIDGDFYMYRYGTFLGAIHVDYSKKIAYEIPTSSIDPEVLQEMHQQHLDSEWPLK